MHLYSVCAGPSHGPQKLVNSGMKRQILISFILSLGIIVSCLIVKNSIGSYGINHVNYLCSDTNGCIKQSSQFQSRCIELNSDCTLTVPGGSLKLSKVHFDSSGSHGTALASGYINGRFVSGKVNVQAPRALSIQSPEPQNSANPITARIDTHINSPDSDMVRAVMKNIDDQNNKLGSEAAKIALEVTKALNSAAMKKKIAQLSFAASIAKSRPPAPAVHPKPPASIIIRPRAPRALFTAPMRFHPSIPQSSIAFQQWKASGSPLGLVAPALPTPMQARRRPPALSLRFQPGKAVDIGTALSAAGLEPADPWSAYRSFAAREAAALPQ